MFYHFLRTEQKKYTHTYCTLYKIPFFCEDFLENSQILEDGESEDVLAWVNVDVISAHTGELTPRAWGCF